MTYRTWTTGDGTRVECAMGVLHQVQSAAREGFIRFRHGGMEIGGILTGTSDGNVVRVNGMRALTIGYGRGASFSLTDAEHEGLRSVIDTANAELKRHGQSVVGWYESHTRRDLALADTDYETYDRHFPKPGDTCVVVKPEKENSFTTAVFVRGSGGSVEEAQFAGDTEVRNDPPAIPAPIIATPAPAPQISAPPMAVAQPAPEPLPEPLPVHEVNEIPRPETPQRPTIERIPSWSQPPQAQPSRRKWIIGATAAAAAGAAAFLGLNRRNEQRQPAAIPAAVTPVNPAPPPSPTPATTATGTDSVDAAKARVETKPKRTSRQRRRRTRARRTTDR